MSGQAPRGHSPVGAVPPGQDPRVPLSILDLAPISSGSDARQALANSVDLARHAEQAGYHRYWLAEHHLSDGLASSATPILIGQIAAATRTLRVGSGATLLGYHTPLAVAEAFGTLEALHPGRIDLGLGRGLAAGRRAAAEAGDVANDKAGAATTAAAANATPSAPAARIINGLLIPAPPVSRPQRSTRGVAREAILLQPHAQPLPFEQAADALFALLAGTYTAADGSRLQATPGFGAALQTWVLGSSAGESAQLAGRLGLPFAVNYHVSPSTALEAVDAYRRAFVPSATHARPYLMISADVVVGRDAADARRIASPYGAWVQGIRRGEGATRYLSPEAAALVELEADLVQDRIDTQFVGDADTVVAGLETLVRATEADELIITTNAYQHEDRVRSNDWLAQAWRRNRTR